MNLLLDIRSYSPADNPSRDYAFSWAKTWLKYSPHSHIRFLAFEGHGITSEFEILTIPKNWGIAPKKSIASHRYGPERILSFSRLPSFDAKIPLTLQIENLSNELFPPENEGFFEAKFRRMNFRKLLKEAHHIIIPEREIGSILSELYGGFETKMSVIPYVTPDDVDIVHSLPLSVYGITGEYFITEGTEGNEWNPEKLLEIFAQYTRHDADKKQLVVIGDMGGLLGNLIPLIRSLGLVDIVKFTGEISHEERKSLYRGAIGWIYIGRYYSRGAAISLARSYDLPLYISDVAGLREYGGVMIHPNRSEMLAEHLLKPYPEIQSLSIPSNDLIMQVYRKILSE